MALSLLPTADPSARAADVLAAARAFAGRAAARAARADDTADFAPDLDDLRQSGLLMAPVPRAQGGHGLGTEPGRDHALYALLREIGRGSLPVGRVYEGHVNALVLVDAFGTEAQRARAAADAADGHLFAVWNTEIPSSGVRLTPTLDDGVEMAGAKTFTSGLGSVTRPVVPGTLPDGRRQMVLVPLDAVDTDQDAGWWTARGMRASRSGRCSFQGVTLGRDAVLGGPDDYLCEPLFSGGSSRFAAVQLGGATALAEAAADHLRALGRTDNETQRLRLGRAELALETGALWLAGAARLARAAREGRASDADVVTYAQGVRSAIEAACLDVMDLVDKAVGARGLLPPSPVERVGRDLRLYLRQPAPDATLAAVGQAAVERPRRPRGSDPLL